MQILNPIMLRLAFALLLLAPLAAAAQLPKIPGVIPGTAPAGPPAAASGAPSQASPDEIRQKLSAVQGELAKIEAPGGLSAGAPPGTSQQDLATRRSLLLQLVGAYQRQISDLASLANAEKRKSEIEDRIRDWKGFDEKPPYSILLVDKLREDLQKTSLRIQGLEARMQILDSRIEATRQTLLKSQEELRRAQEQLEATRGDAVRTAVAGWQRDLAALGSRAAGASIASLEVSRDATTKDLALARLEFGFVELQLKEAEKDVRFSREDLDVIKARIGAKRDALQKELDAELDVREKLEQALTDTTRRLKEQRAALDKTKSDIAAAREALATAEAEAQPPRGEDKSLLKKLNPVDALAAKRARDEAARLKTKIAALEKDAAARDAAVASLERSDEINGVRSRNSAILVELLGNLISGTAIQSGFWELRYAAMSGEPGTAVDLRKMYDGSRQLLDRLKPIGNYLRHQLQLTLSQIAQQQNAQFAAPNAIDAEQAKAMVEALGERERIYLRALGETEDVRQLMERWVTEFRGQVEERGAAARTRYWLDSARDVARSVWNYELFTVEDSIEVDGQKITGSRGITVSKIIDAILILVVGYYVIILMARLLRRWAVKRWNADPKQARLASKWLVALAVVVLVLVSLHLVKIPIEVFAFLGGAVAIGAGFGMQNLLKNLISGVMLILERPFRLGDIVEVGSIRGEVTDINVRSCTIRDVNSIETLIPNSTFIEQNVTNWTYSNKRVRFSVKVGVAYGSTVRDVADLLQEAAGRHGLILKDPEPEVLFEDFGADALIFGLYYWLELRPGVVSRIVASDLRYMIDKSFAEHGIAIAFPQRDVHLDTARPLEVRVVEPPGTGT